MKHEFIVFDENGGEREHRYFVDAVQINSAIRLNGFSVEERFLQCKEICKYLVRINGNCVKEDGWPTTPIQVGDTINTPYCDRSKVMKIKKKSMKTLLVRLAFNGVRNNNCETRWFVDGICVKYRMEIGRYVKEFKSERIDEDYFRIECTAYDKDRLTSKEIGIFPCFKKDIDGTCMLTGEYYGPILIEDIGESISINSGETAILRRVRSRVKSAYSAKQKNLPHIFFAN